MESTRGLVYECRLARKTAGGAQFETAAYPRQTADDAEKPTGVIHPYRNRRVRETCDRVSRERSSRGSFADDRRANRLGARGRPAIAVEMTVKCNAAAGGLARFDTEVWAAATVASSNAAKTIVILMHPLPAVGPIVHPLELPSARIAVHKQRHARP